jgi:hypothetical protein
MAINRYYNRTPYDLGLYTPPVDMMYKTLETLQKRYETNSAVLDEIRNAYIQALPQDKARATQIQNTWFKSVDDMVAKSGGDLASITKDLNKLVAGIKRDMSPMGEAGNIMGNYTKYQDWTKRHQERLAKGEIIGTDFAQANKYVMNKYSGVKFNEETGTWVSDLDLSDMSNYVPIDEIANKQLQLLNGSPDAYKRKTSVLGRDGLFHDEEHSYKGVGKDRIRGALLTTLGADPRVQGYLADKMKYSGLDPSQASAFLQLYADGMGESYKWEQREDGMELRRDPNSTAMLKHRLNNQLLESFLPLMEGELAPAGLGANQAGYGELNADILAKVSGDANFYEDKTRALQIFQKSVFGSPSGLTDIGPVKKARNFGESMSNIFRDPVKKQRLQNNGIDANLLERIYKDYSKESLTAQQFEEKVMQAYNASAKNMSAFKTYEVQVQPAAKEEILKTYLPGLLIGNKSYYDPATKNTYRNLPKDIGKVLEEAKKDPDLVDVAIVGPQPGNPTGGIRVTARVDPGIFSPDTPKTIIIPTPYTKVKDKFTGVYSMFKPIFEQGSTIGAKGADGSYPIRVFERDVNGTYYDRIFMATENDKGKYQDPVTNKSVDLYDFSLMSLQEQLANDLAKLMPRGASKSDQTLFPLFLQLMAGSE